MLMISIVNLYVFWGSIHSGLAGNDMGRFEDTLGELITQNEIVDEWLVIDYHVDLPSWPPPSATCTAAADHSPTDGPPPRPPIYKVTLYNYSPFGTEIDWCLSGRVVAKRDEVVDY